MGCSASAQGGSPTLYYMPIAARGEVTRMIAKTGGLAMQDVKTMGADVDKPSFGSPGSLPVLQHDDLKLSQSHAIVSYILGMSPKFRNLTPGQQAKDLQFNAIMDDIMSGGVPFFFGKDPEMKQKIGEVLDKWFPVLEKIVPADGFVNGLKDPTGADYVIVVLYKGLTPFRGLYNIAEMDPFAKCPKLKGVAERTLALPYVTKYMSESETMEGNPLGFPTSGAPTDASAAAGSSGREEEQASSTEKPTLYYMPIAARGEVTRMIAKTGGLEIEDVKTMGADVDKPSFGSPGSLPVFQHGNLKLSQSHAIVSYVLGMSPKFKSLTPGQKAKDLQFNAIMDDIMSGGVPFFFGKDPEMKKKVGEVLDKWFPVLEGIVPAGGFVNGLQHPTGADYVVVVLYKGHTPFRGLYNIAEMDPFAKCPKLKGLAERTLAVPDVNKCVSESETMEANPLGFP